MSRLTDDDKGSVIIGQWTGEKGHGMECYFGIFHLSWIKHIYMFSHVQYLVFFGTTIYCVFVYWSSG